MRGANGAVSFAERLRNRRVYAVAVACVANDKRCARAKRVVEPQPMENIGWTQEARDAAYLARKNNVGGAFNGAAGGAGVAVVPAVAPVQSAYAAASSVAESGVSMMKAPVEGTVVIVGGKKYVKRGMNLVPFVPQGSGPYIPPWMKFPKPREADLTMGTFGSTGLEARGAFFRPIPVVSRPAPVVTGSAGSQSVNTLPLPVRTLPGGKPLSPGSQPVSTMPVPTGPRPKAKPPMTNPNPRILPTKPVVTRPPTMIRKPDNDDYKKKPGWEKIRF